MKKRIYYYKPTPRFVEAASRENFVVIYQTHGKRLADCTRAVQHRRAVAVTHHDLLIFLKLADAIGFKGQVLDYTPEVAQ